jgi:GxxExxY protein
MPNVADIPHQELTYRIIGAAMRVHRRTPRGLYEKHYQAALQAELIADGLSAPSEYHTELYAGEVWLGRLYLDHWVNECVVVELKAVAHPMGDDEIAQVIAYLAAMNAGVGLLINFGRQRLEYRRILPPRVMQGWHTHIAKYLWRPNTHEGLPPTQHLGTAESDRDPKTPSGP